jgi:hypothetical protein
MDLTIDERRRLAWYLRYGAGWTLEEIGKELGRTKETINAGLRIIECKIYRSWRNNRLPSTLPAWWRRLRASGALRKDEPYGIARLPILIPPQEETEK